MTFYPTQLSDSHRRQLKEESGITREVYEELRRQLKAEYDDGGAIGRRYRRQDEIGTPFAVTIDHQTIEDDTVTLRDRDTLEQERVPVEALAKLLADRLSV